MTAAAVRIRPVPAPATGPPEQTPRRHSEARAARYAGRNHSPHAPVLLLPGTLVTASIGDRVLRGEVMQYDLEWSHGGFPVRFAATQQWLTMLAGDVTVVEAPAPDPPGATR